MPAEWEPHQATWLAWPHAITTWPGCLDEAERAYREALALAPGVTRWTTAANVPGGDARSIEIDLELSAEGAGVATVVETCHGAPAVAWRRILRQIPAAELDRRFEQLYLGRIVAVADPERHAADAKQDNRADDQRQAACIRQAGQGHAARN